VNWKRKKVVVTGGLGFIGSHLVESLLGKGAEVVVVDSSIIRPNLYRKKVADYEETCQRFGVYPSMHDIDLQFEAQNLRPIFKDCDTVFHLAAYFGGRGFVQEKQTECSAMFAVDQNVFRVAFEEGVKRINYASSACVYPDGLQTDRQYLLKEEDAIPTHGWESADNIYGWAKLMGEQQLSILHKQNGVSCSSCRFLTVYGPREYDDSHAIAALINRSIRREDPFVVWGNGFQERGFTYVTDIVNGIILSSEMVVDGAPLNLGVDWRVSIRRVVELIHEYVKFKPRSVTYDTSKPVGPISRTLDMSKTKATLDWVPTIGLEEGLKQTTAWHEQNFRYLVQTVD
jgi:nucleoside-diphosphate-sugar epimerase